MEIQFTFFFKRAPSVGTSVSDEDNNNMYHIIVTVFPQIQPESQWTTTMDKAVIPSVLLSWPLCFNLRNFKFPLRIPDFFKMLLLLQSLFDHSEFLTRETRHKVPSCNKARIHVVYLKNSNNWMYCQILQRSAFWPTGQLLVQVITQTKVLYPLSSIRLGFESMFLRRSDLSNWAIRDAKKCTVTNRLMHWQLTLWF